MLPDASIIDADQFKIKTSLGEGAFAFVNLAELDNGRLVAVKTLKAELLENPNDVKLFLKETELMRKIRNPAIVDLIGVGGKLDPSGSGEFLDLYIVQEYCSGGSLRDIVYKQMTINRKFLYTQADALRWCISIAKALNYLHSANPKVIHRDLKLDNVLLTDTNPALASAKLADFGLAKLMAKTHKGQQRRQELQILAKKSEDQLLPTERSRSLSVRRVMLSLDSFNWNSSVSESALLGINPAVFKSNSIFIPEDSASAAAAVNNGDDKVGHGIDMTGEAGSYSYMAPEVLQGSQYDEKADIFSFAMLMYNIFYRVIPSVLIVANGGSPEDMSMLAWETANGYRPKLSTTGNIPESVNSIINECWSGVAELRPSADVLVTKLLEIQKSGVCKGSSSSNVGGKSSKSGGTKDAASGGCSCSMM
jgi:serine/threonine protein kinase